MDSGTIAVATDMLDPDLSPEPDSGNESGLGSEHSQDGSSIKPDEGDEDASNSNQVFSGPVQKRRRVTRACDECRRKKIKCDGKQPCTHCSVYSYECTYDKPSNRRRNPAPQYIEALENKLARAEALLRKFIPDVDLSDPNLDPTTQQEFQNRERQRLQAVKLKREQEAQKSEHCDTRITSMIETIGQLDLDERGGWDFRGTSSGAVFLRRMKEHFGGVLGFDPSSTILPRPSRIPDLPYLNSSRSTAGSSPGGAESPNAFDLPPQERARQLIVGALTCATALLRIIHVPSFFERFEMIYSKPVDEFDLEDKRFVGLLYSVMAVGAMYNTAEGEDFDNQVSYTQAAEEGMKYYTSARILLQDFTECRDLTSLQGLLFLILFLQAVSNLSACYAFLGIAMRAALRMGLHRHLPHANFTPLVTELRRRIFYFIRQLDIYCSAVLGFPILLHDEDIDQQLPTEVDDEYITPEGITTPPPKTPGSVFQAFNAHSRLMGILMKVVKYIYPLKGVEECATVPKTATYMIDYRYIREIETDLQVWHEQLPQRWRPSAEGPIEVLRHFVVTPELILIFDKGPFLHYISPRLSAGRVVDDQYYACAAAGISVSRNIIHIAMEIKNHALVVGPFWSMLYTQFFAILTLVFYVIENPEKQGTAEIFADAAAGREIITKMAQKTFAADRISKSLDTLWESLPDSVKNGKAKALPSRKRAAPGPKPGLVPMSATRSHGSSNKITSAAPTRSLQQKPSFDNGRRASIHRALSSNYPDIPLDFSSIGTSSDMSATSSATHPSNQFIRTSQTVESPSIYKLDALMFPSGDPFAYPNQPLLDYGNRAVSTHAESNPSHISVVHGQQTDSRNFYMPGIYGDIEGQLMGHVPSYLMQSTPGQSNMYQPPNSLGVQQVQAHHAVHGQHAHNHPHPHQRMSWEMDDLMADSGFNRSWDMFGGNFKPL